MFRAIYRGRSPLDFEAFPPGATRSAKGALALVPNASFDATADEVEALQAAGVRLQIISSPAVAAPAAPVAEAQTSAAKGRRKR
jgi:hypothetical protein